MKKVLGLDIGTNSVGFALLSINSNNKLENIDKLGVRIVLEDPNFHTKFVEGASASKNNERTNKRGTRRLNQRFKQRRDRLSKVLKENNMFPTKELIQLSSIDLYKLRYKAINEQITLEELGRVLYHLNQRRGFKSNRKSQTEEENKSDFKQKLSDFHNILSTQTIGCYLYKQIKENPQVRIRENIFPREEFIKEFDIIWNKQKSFYPEILTGDINNNKKGSLYHTIKEEIIYFQRPLKSQKHLVSNCTFEVKHKAIPKSSPLFQYFRIWTVINSIEISDIDGQKYYPTIEQKEELFNILYTCKGLNQKCTLPSSKVLTLLNYPKDHYLNYTELEGNKFYNRIEKALVKAEIKNHDKYLFYNPLYKHNNRYTEEFGGLYELWHLSYSIENNYDLINSLSKRFKFSKAESEIIANNIGYTSEYGSLSAKAIRKILPYLQKGMNYYEACKEVGYNHSEIKVKKGLDKLDIIKSNSLRNPVVEQIINQVINVVNELCAQYGKPDEIRVELARELKNSAKTRDKITNSNKANRKNNEEIAAKLLEHEYFKNKRVSLIDIKRYKLWMETNCICLYSGKTISFTQLYNGETEIEHIIPRTRCFNDSMSNKIIVFTKENKLKDQDTAFDYMKNKGVQELARYSAEVNKLYREDKKINEAKYNNLLCAGNEISNDFIERQLKDSQYIAKKTREILMSICDNVVSTTGSITDFLRTKWGLTEVMKELNKEKYRQANRIYKKQIKDRQGNPKEVEDIKDWTKRDDHRHHAVDALLIALTNQSIIQQLNNLNQVYDGYRNIKKSPLDFNCPSENLRKEAEKALSDIWISFKKPKSKVVTPKINKNNRGQEQLTWVPRGSLHEDTVMGKIKIQEKIKIKEAFKNPENIISEKIKQQVVDRIESFNGDTKKAILSISKNPILFKDEKVSEVKIWSHTYTKRVKIDKDITAAQISKIIDKNIKKLIEDRIKESGSIKKAFTNYNNNPLWLNKDKGIAIKSVKVKNEGNLIAVRTCQEDNKQNTPKDYVNTKNNHHALIYEDNTGKRIDRVISMWEAVELAKNNIRETGKPYPVIDRTDKDDLKFLFSMQINDLFVFDLDPNEIDFFAKGNRALISENLFRVQTISKGDYFFRHHLETKRANSENFAVKRISTSKLNCIKVKIDKLGNLIKIGE